MRDEVLLLTHRAPPEPSGPFVPLDRKERRRLAREAARARGFRVGRYGWAWLALWASMAATAALIGFAALKVFAP